MARGRAPATKRGGSFWRTVVIVALAVHVPVVATLAELARELGAASPWRWALACVAAVALALFVPLRLAKLRPDRPRSKVSLALELPYYAHFSAALASSLPVLIYALLRPALAPIDALRSTLPTVGRLALATYGALLALACWGVFVRRRWVRVRHVAVPLANLPDELEGYRIVHLSDLHIGALTPPAWAERWAKTANALAPDLIAITGDLVTSGTAFHGAITEVMARLSARDGVLVSMGNHDYFGDGEGLANRLEQRGIHVLRNEHRAIVRGAARLRIAGIDDTWSRRADPALALARVDGATETVVALAHEPSLFEAAVELGAHLVLSGHTHGGQVALPFFARTVSLGRLTHRHFLGLYRHRDAFLYVNPGLGTTGLPIRLGVPPEITVLRLQRAR